MQPTEADYIVVGGGLTGCALASRLAEGDSSAKILLIEAGIDATGDARCLTPMGCFALGHSELDWAYQTVPQPHTNNRSHYNAAGKVLGGGSVLNYGGWSRGDQTDYDDWAKVVGDSRWSYEGMLPFFRKSEHHFDPNSDPKQHGFEGPIRYVSVSQSDPKRLYPLRGSIRDAWHELGVEDNPDSNSGNIAGLSECEENWHDGRRQPSHQAYSIKGVEILTKSVVERVLIRANPEGRSEVSGVQLIDGTQITARKEVILSAGAHRTPQLLMLSGIGPKEELSKHGIPLVKDLPHVGQNMFDHFSLLQFWKLLHPEQGLSMGTPLWKDPAYSKGLPCDFAVKEHVPDNLLSDALSSDSASDVEASTLLNPTRCRVETMIVYAPAGAAHVKLQLPMDGTHVASSVMLLLPTSRGHISLASASIADPPVIDPNYYATSTDRAALIYGTRRVMKALLDTKAGKTFIANEVTPPGMGDLTLHSKDEEIDKRIRSAGVSHAHASGTAAMGKVVDTNLRVYGVNGLRGADSSVFPVAIGGHPQATLYALAEQAAHIILTG